MNALLTIFVIILVIYFFRKNSKEKKKIIQTYKTSEFEKKEISSSFNKIEDEKMLYKTKGIKSFEIRGTYYRDLNETDAGDFIGHVSCEYNSHDQYAVGIYNDNDYLIGYVPKGNRRLNESLTEWHNEKVIAWGNLQFDDYDNKWYGVVYIPVGLNEKQIRSIEETFDLIKNNKTLISKKDLTTSEYFEILENHKKIKSNLNIIKDKDNLFYYFPKTLIPSLSKKLESEKDWNNLIKIEEHEDLLNDLSETFRNSTLKRIEKAKGNLELK